MGVIFGVAVPTYTPTTVFPYDPSVNYHRGRKWQTSVVQFSPVLEQRFILSNSPLITFEIGFNAITGHFPDPTSMIGTLWQFFQSQQGRSSPFYYYDPAVWATYPNPYRDNPVSRLSHPTDSAVARYIALFAEDDMSAEFFEYKLRKAQLKIEGFPG